LDVQNDSEILFFLSFCKIIIVFPLHINRNNVTLQRKSLNKQKIDRNE
jgi:hypothetical protein